MSLYCLFPNYFAEIYTASTSGDPSTPRCLWSNLTPQIVRNVQIMWWSLLRIYSIGMLVASCVVLQDMPWLKSTAPLKMMRSSTFSIQMDWILILAGSVHMDTFFPLSHGRGSLHFEIYSGIQHLKLRWVSGIKIQRIPPKCKDWWPGREGIDGFGHILITILWGMADENVLRVSIWHHLHLVQV